MTKASTKVVVCMVEVYPSRSFLNLTIPLLNTA